MTPAPVFQVGDAIRVKVLPDYWVAGKVVFGGLRLVLELDDHAWPLPEAYSWAEWPKVTLVAFWMPGLGWIDAVGGEPMEIERC